MKHPRALSGSTDPYLELLGGARVSVWVKVPHWLYCASRIIGSDFNFNKLLPPSLKGVLSCWKLPTPTHIPLLCLSPDQKVNSFCQLLFLVPVITTELHLASSPLFLVLDFFFVVHLQTLSADL